MSEEKRESGGILGFLKKLIDFLLGRKTNKKK